MNKGRKSVEYAGQAIKISEGVKDTERTINLEEMWETDEYSGLACASQIRPPGLMPSIRSTSALVNGLNTI